ncbi:MAG: polysaccharide deacetylase family protein [Lachnospiraceae bacterium]|nr:polysaccharide deacetylase family protein [Lachnospiraceae bacterium]
MGAVNYRKAVTFSYDDGVSQDIRLVSIFRKYGMKATFNLNTGIQTEESRFEIQGVPIHRMNQSDGLEQVYQGHEIALHGLTHAAPSDLDSQKYEQEFLQDARNIQRIYGKYPLGMAYAYGDYSDEIIRYLQQIGMQYGRTVESSHQFALPQDPMRLQPTCHHNDECLFELAEKFLAAEPKQDEPMLFYIWGHSYEFDVEDNWDRIETLCSMLGDRDDIFYGTNAECLGLVGE